MAAFGTRRWVSIPSAGAHFYPLPVVGRTGTFRPGVDSDSIGRRSCGSTVERHRMIFSEKEIGRLRDAMIARASAMARHYFGRPGFPDAEDLAQQTLLRLLDNYGEESLGAFDPARVYALAYRILNNLVIDAIRKKREQPEPPGGEAGAGVQLVDPRPDPEAAMERVDAENRVRRVLDEVLTTAERRFLVLSFELESAPLAAEACGWPPGDRSPSSLCHLRRRLLRKASQVIRDRERRR